jgi:hypothetical protein
MLKLPVKVLELTNGRTMEIYVDDSPPNPRIDLDNVGRMICGNNKHSLGDEHTYAFYNYNSFDGLKIDIMKDNDVAIILPLYLSERNSGLMIAVTPFDCSRDSRQIGFIYCTDKQIGEEFGSNIGWAKQCLLAEVETYDQYLRGDVYGFVIRGAPCKECGNKGGVEDACWGFYGKDFKKNGMLDHLSEEDRTFVLNNHGG